MLDIFFKQNAFPPILIKQNAPVSVMRIKTNTDRRRFKKKQCNQQQKIHLATSFVN